jgi:hypothetical protein
LEVVTASNDSCSEVQTATSTWLRGFRRMLLA